MRNAGGLLALFAGLYGVVAAIITLIVLGGLGATTSVDPKGVLLGWVGLGLSLMISGLGAATICTSSPWPVLLLLLCALTGAVISETLVSVCMAGALVIGLLANGGRVSIHCLPLANKALCRPRRWRSIDSGRGRSLGREGLPYALTEGVIDRLGSRAV